MSKLVEVKGRVIWTFVALVAFASGLVMPYFEGRTNSWWAIPPTQIQKLDLSLMIFVRPEETEIVWGGALAGHRGVIILTGRPGNDQRSRLSKALFIADDIATFVSAD